MSGPTVVAAWLVEWSSPTYVVINGLATVVWVAALVDLVRSPRGEWYTRRGAVIMVFVVAFLSLYVAGAFVPIGAIGWFGWWRRLGGLGRVPRRS